jgi:hypothetical protein
MQSGGTVSLFLLHFRHFLVGVLSDLDRQGEAFTADAEACVGTDLTTLVVFVSELS